MELTLDNESLFEDQKLRDGLLQRLPEAMERLHMRYRTILRSIIMQVLHDDTETDDVLQEVLLQVWDRAESYSPGKGRMVSWLCTLARRRAIDHLRQHGAYRRATDRYEVSCSQQANEGHKVEGEASRDDIKALLQQHLKELPADQEQVVRMAFLESRSQREIAAITQTPLGTVKTRIELGMKKLSRAFNGMRTEMI